MIDKDSDLLIIVDPQNDFCEGGALAVPGANDEYIKRVNEFAKKFKHIVISQDWHPAGHSSFASSHDGMNPFEQIQMPYGTQTLWPDHCVQGTPGADFHPLLDTDRAAVIIRKGMNPNVDSYSAFKENDRVSVTGLSGLIRGLDPISRVIVVGLAYDFCVQFTARDTPLEYETVVVEDLCRAISSDSEEVATKAMILDGVIITTSDLI